jgi:hypothetical protein
MPYQSTDRCFTHFLVDLMINGFDSSNWNNNNKSDPSPLILPDDFIVAIEDEYNLMTDRLMRGILKAPPHGRIRHQVGILKKVETNQHLSSYTILFHHQTYLTM